MRKFHPNGAEEYESFCEEARRTMLKSGWCMTNHHHICPAEFITAGKCNCPCHVGITPEEISARHAIIQKIAPVSQTFIPEPPKPKEPLKLRKRRKPNAQKRSTDI